MIDSRLQFGESNGQRVRKKCRNSKLQKSDYILYRLIGRFSTILRFKYIVHRPNSLFLHSYFYVSAQSSEIYLKTIKLFKSYIIVYYYSYRNPTVSTNYFFGPLRFVILLKTCSVTEIFCGSFEISVRINTQITKICGFPVISSFKFHADEKVSLQF